MINLQVTVSERDRANINALAREFPREMLQANGRAASIVKRKVRAAMSRGGGTPDVPSFAALHPLTVALKARSQPGGILADGSVIVSYRLGKAQIIGWPDKLQGIAQAFQSAQSRETTKQERRMFHIRAPGIEDIPAYARPARPVIEPLSATVDRDYPKWIMGAATKIIGKKLAKRGF
jgi:hypothetical protein